MEQNFLSVLSKKNWQKYHQMSVTIGLWHWKIHTYVQSKLEKETTITRRYAYCISQKQTRNLALEDVQRVFSSFLSVSTSREVLVQPNK